MTQCVSQFITSVQNADCSQCKTLFSPCKWNVTTIVPLTNAYEINHIWELRKWYQMKNDPRSCERNLCNNCVRRLKKNIQDFNGIWTRDLAILVRCSNQLSYEATDSPIVFYPWKQWSAVYILDCPPIYTWRINKTWTYSFFFYKIILVLGNQGSIIENVIHPFNLKTLNCDQNTYSAYLKF